MMVHTAIVASLVIIGALGAAVGVLIASIVIKAIGLEREDWDWCRDWDWYWQ